MLHSGVPTTTLETTVLQDNLLLCSVSMIQAYEARISDWQIPSMVVIIIDIHVHVFASLDDQPYLVAVVFVCTSFWSQQRPCGPDKIWRLELSPFLGKTVFWVPLEQDISLTIFIETVMKFDPFFLSFQSTKAREKNKRGAVSQLKF